jgi:hypothetical protein
MNRAFMEESFSFARADETVNDIWLPHSLIQVIKEKGASKSTDNTPKHA